MKLIKIFFILALFGFFLKQFTLKTDWIHFLNYLNDSGKSNYVMLFAHRGDYGEMRQRIHFKHTKIVLMQVLMELKLMCK